jgi:hypothetical protein
MKEMRELVAMFVGGECGWGGSREGEGVCGGCGCQVNFHILLQTTTTLTAAPIGAAQELPSESEWLRWGYKASSRRSYLKRCRRESSRLVFPQ